MSQHEDRQVADWLAAEAEGRLDDADLLFTQVLSARVPRLQPAPGLADRVVGALGLGHRLAFPWLAPVPRWLRAATLALVAGGGLAAAAFWSVSVFDLVRASWTVAKGLRLVAMLAGALVDVVVHTWANAASIAGALSLVATSGTGAAILAANLVLAVAASIGLRRVLASTSAGQPA